MRLTVALALAGLAATGYFAPGVYNSRTPGVAPDTMFDTDPAVRAKFGEDNRSLGVALAGYQEKSAEDLTDLVTLRRRIQTCMRLGAVSLGEPGLPQLVREGTTLYLDHREQLDPDGKWLQSMLSEWLELRLHHQYFHAQAGAALWLAGRLDKRGLDQFMYYADFGPFYREFFPYVRRFHPNFEGIRPIIERYLTGSELGGRVEAAATLLSYHHLWGVGADLLKRHRAEIAAALRESVERLRPERRDTDFAMHANATFFGLALFGGTDERKILKSLHDLDYADNIDLLRIARMAAGLDTFNRFPLGSEMFQLLSEGAKEYYFRAATYRFATLWRQAAAETDTARRTRLEREAENVRQIPVAGLDSSLTPVVIACFMGLAAVDPQAARDLPDYMIRVRGGVPSLFAAAMTKVDDPLAVLLPGVSSDAPDYAALAAVSLLDIDGPPAIQVPTHKK